MIQPPRGRTVVSSAPGRGARHGGRPPPGSCRRKRRLDQRLGAPAGLHFGDGLAAVGTLEPAEIGGCRRAPVGAGLAPEHRCGAGLARRPLAVVAFPGGVRARVARGDAFDTCFGDRRLDAPGRRRARPVRAALARLSGRSVGDARRGARVEASAIWSRSALP